MISLDPADHEIRQEKHYYPFGLHMEHPDFWVDYPAGDRYQYNSIENLSLSNALLYAAHYRTLDPSLGRWLQVDPAAESFYGLTPYNSMGNNPMLFVDPDGDFIVPIIIGAAIGAAISGGTTIAMNLAMGNKWSHGLGDAMAFGAVGGAIGAGLGAAFAGTSFGHSTSFGILNNMASTAAISAAFGNDFTWGTLAGGIAGGLIRGQANQYSGSVGGSFINGMKEIAHMAHSGAFIGMVSGGIEALVDGKSVGRGMYNGLLHGALGGASQASLNIATMGTTYLPDQSYGDFGEFGPVYRRGNIITRTFFPDTGVAIGRNLVTNEGDKDYIGYLRAHETKHFIQQRRLGFGGFYTRILREYINPGYGPSMRIPGHLEYEAHQYGERFRNH